MTKTAKGVMALMMIAAMANGKCTMEQIAYTTGYDAGQSHADKEGYEASFLTSSACQSALEIYSGKPNKHFSAMCKSGAKDGLNAIEGAKWYKSECTYF